MKGFKFNRSYHLMRLYWKNTMVHIEYVTKLVKLLLHVTSLATQCPRPTGASTLRCPVCQSSHYSYRPRMTTPLMGLFFNTVLLLSLPSRLF